MSKGNFLVLILLIEVIFFVIFRQLEPVIPPAAKGKATTHDLTLGQHLLLITGGVLGIIFTVIIVRTLVKAWKRL